MRTLVLHCHLWARVDVSKLKVLTSFWLLNLIPSWSMALEALSRFQCVNLQQHSFSFPSRSRTNVLQGFGLSPPLRCNPGGVLWSDGGSTKSKCGSHSKQASPTIEVEDWIKKARADRLQHLEDQALSVLRKTVEMYQHPAFPCALIAGDVVILDLLNKLGALSTGQVKVIFIDTFHLFRETHTFLESLEKRYGFKSHVFHAADVKSKEEYREKYGSDLFIRDIEEYDRLCKVEPFSRSLESLKVDAMINGRRRDHGAERAHLEVIEGGKPAKVQPLAYWEFRDVWDYLESGNIPYHPLHDEGYPSIGDVHSTLPVPKDKWFEYGGERSGRFQGLKNKDGSDKTECGIHVGGSQ